MLIGAKIASVISMISPSIAGTAEDVQELTVWCIRSNGDSIPTLRAALHLLGSTAILVFAAAIVSAAVPSPLLFNQAVDALKALQSSAKPGISYGDYSRKVEQTRKRVDMYVNANPDEANVPTVSMAMQYFESAGMAWDAHLSGNAQKKATAGTKLKTDPIFKECAPLKDVLTRAGDNNSIADAVGAKPEVLWACASDKINKLRK